MAHGGRLWGRRPHFAPRLRRPLNPKTLRATMGACFRLPVWEGTLEDLLPPAEEGWPAPLRHRPAEDTVDLRQITLDRAAVVIGSEGRG